MFFQRKRYRPPGGDFDLQRSDWNNSSHWRAILPFRGSILGLPILLAIEQMIEMNSDLEAARAANSNLNSNSKELDHFAELELKLEKMFFLNSNLYSHKTIRVN